MKLWSAHLKSSKERKLEKWGGAGFKEDARFDSCFRKVIGRACGCERDVIEQSWREFNSGSFERNFNVLGQGCGGGRKGKEGCV